ncbi:MAG: nucleotide modification associated domain-containing protein [Candidatus Woesearchaeota archaeon]|jgi:hypothetical protein|nr:nucleotide modification associated domain-containing protein [Candidatus Woesearchaeota archaeon]MDP7182002.1 nucleotide modification associated domain-containing protein [Candidatus Woesearchaeota archaeon]MDP7198946.1 nucleotide modification associated domain-containing protein [Candidatus Woesearchaeota archaeon]MDP7467326.1 nucleotide modification associated domain-containing protein [Candidatus Woesearchaeota archaeon]MDP7646620.1 nucleotide modification associated domain-containing pro
MDIAILDETLSSIRELLIEKNKRYGEANIRKFGSMGVVIRSSDKVERLRTLLFDKVEASVDESVEDSWKDLAGYAIIGAMLQQEKW